jgi:colanic acid/amylovoran biosynthesis glycosyltransferase
MRVAFFLTEFAVLSQPFVLNQITGMIDRGHEVDIYVKYRRKANKHHPQIASYGLMEKARFFSDMPRDYPQRMMKAIGLILRRGLWRRPAMIWKALVSSEGGRFRVSMSLLFPVLTLADRGRYDILHCQFGTLGPLVLELRMLGATDGEIVTSFRGYDLTKVLSAKPGFYDQLFRYGALFLPVSKSLRDKLVASGCPTPRIRVLHSGIDSGAFSFSERGKCRDEATRLLSIGRFVEKKGFEYAIEAVANARRTGRDIHYTIVGDGELRGQLEKKIQDRGIGDSVRLRGWCEHSEINRLLEDSHVFVAPSVTAEDGDQEGIPNVLKEAMAAGLPVLSTWHSGIPELVDNEVTGHLVAERDVDALTERLIYLCDHREKWARMGRRARERIEADFDMDRINDRLEALYKGVTPG